jgi:hypothetical protein
MALRKLLTRPLPELPEEAPGLRSIVEQILATPQLAPLRVVWYNWRDLQPWWPVLLPLLIWVFVRTYQRERAKILT